MAAILGISNLSESNDRTFNANEEQQDASRDGIEQIPPVVEDGVTAKNGFTPKGGASPFNDRQDGEKTEDKVEKSKPSKLKVMWQNLGLDLPTVMMMFKASLPPLIGLAFYQSLAVAATYSTLGYLVAIISILSMPILPRAKYLQTLIFNIIGICIGTAVALVGIWSGVQARLHTTPARTAVQYNSSQSAVCAMWLFANIWFVNLLRAKVPALQFPVIMYSIFTNVAFTFGPIFQTYEQGQALIMQLLECFLTALAIGTGVSLFVFPVSSRTVVLGEMAGYIGAVRGTIKAQSAYLQSLEKSDMFSQSVEEDVHDEEPSKEESSRDAKSGETVIECHPEAKALKGAVAGLAALHGKLQGDLSFAKREISYGKLRPKDLDEVFKLLQGILIPLIGMSTITDIFERIAERRGWIEIRQKSDFDTKEAWEQDHDAKAKLKEKKLWNDIMKELHEPFSIASQAMDAGLEHAGLVLELIKPPKMKKDTVNDVDIEAKGDVMKPGEDGFADYMEMKMETFYSQRGNALRAWALEKGLSREKWDTAKSPALDGEDITTDEVQHTRDQQQLYLILYMEFLLYSTGSAILKLIHFAEDKVADGTLKKNRLIHPGLRRVRKWIMNVVTEDSVVDNSTPDSLESGSSTVRMGAGFNNKKDPEHLPATSKWQKFGNGVRKVSHLLGSKESAFGIRVAMATMTIGIIAFLESTQIFFIEQRLVWAMIIIAIGMTITSGQSIFGFLARTGGTALSMVLSSIIWYIVDAKTPGVLVMLWFFIFIEYYLFLKFPRFLPVWLICIITQVLIIGYELQVQVIGIEASSANGQPYYPIYELAPYRLACMAVGCLVAFIWTIFPYPLSDRGWLRKDLGLTMHLLANYYSVIHSTIHARIHHAEGDMEDKTSPGRQLEKIRHKIFGKLLLVLPSLEQHADWQKWEPTIGGKFPKETYDTITQRLTNIMHYLSLMSYTTQTWSTDAFPKGDPGSHSEWLKDLTTLMDSVGPTSNSITSILTLLSAAVSEGFALPPHMELPQPYLLSRRLEALDKGILDAKHVKEAGYSAFAVTQVASSLVSDDLRRLVADVKELVGEVDFSFQIVDSESSSEVESTGVHNGKGKGKQD